ncbi:MAG: long-chain fatty acid--CoA ligase, partial [Candidatus Rokubacteria bacterium]|nr:long-chain fatty acid--CoA ligase [Candidatus Rokubacteria bacterium]
MKGLIMDFPLTLPLFFERARRLFPRKEIVTRTLDGRHRYTYADFADRALRLASALQSLGIGKGDRVATFAWNSHRHLEAYFAVPCMGAVLHTLNIRLAPDHLTYIINHAEDRILLVDASLLGLIEPIRKDLKTVRHVVVMPDGPSAPSFSVRDYEALLRDARPLEAWPRLDEPDAAGMCYTSGTTGHPKGVVYSHRAIVLHTYVLALPDSFGLTERDVCLFIVPMFHVNAWGFPYAATLVGATQVYAGPTPQPRDLLDLIASERVTITGAVPTVWINMLPVLEQERFDLSSLRTAVVGGSAMPRSLIELYEKKHGVRLTHAWGMTEMTPLGTVSRLKSWMEAWPEADRYAVRAKQGLPVPGVEIRGVDEEGREIPWDGKTMGELQVRGSCVTSGYYNYPEGAEAITPDGWFRTGDVVTIDPEGYIQIMDRTKDLVKSGGEWISTVDLESLLMAHPKVLEAAVIAVPHPRWQERPLACVVLRPGQTVTRDELLEFLRPRVARWWLP